MTNNSAEAAVMNSYYEVWSNTDQTEGRGSQRPVGVVFDHSHLTEAITYITGTGLREHGVMGVTGVELYEVNWVPTGDGQYSLEKERIWGYRRDLAGQWSYGFVDNRDAELNDPEFAEYLRLKDKFEKGESK